MSTATWDPEVAALLREIAADERSTMRTLPPPTVGELLRPQVITDRMAFLTKAEQQLLTVHRETVAKLLEDVAFGMMFGGGGWRAEVTNYVTNTDAVEARPREELRASTVALPTPSEVDAAEAVDVLRRSFQSAEFGPPSAGVLLTRAVRIAPTTRSRLLLTAWLATEGQPRTALQLGSSMSARMGRTPSRADALAYMGKAHHELGDAPNALQAYRDANELVGGYAVFVYFYLFQAVQIGNLPEARRASDALAQAAPDPIPLVSYYQRYLSTSRARGAWHPTAASRSIVASLKRSESLVTNVALSVFDQQPEGS